MEPIHITKQTHSCYWTFYWQKSCADSTSIISEKEILKGPKDLLWILLIIIVITIVGINNYYYNNCRKHSLSALKASREGRMEMKMISTVSSLPVHCVFLQGMQFRGFLSCSKLCLHPLWVLLHYFHPLKSLPFDPCSFLWSLSASAGAAHSQVYAISTAPWGLQTILSQHAHLLCKGRGSPSLLGLDLTQLFKKAYRNGKWSVQKDSSLWDDNTVLWLLQHP